MNKFYLILVLLAGFACQPQQGKHASSSQKPNFLIILADDMGYSDLGCYGGEIHTPTLDQLAEEGLRFTQFYNAARCCPTRASLLTGLSPHLAGMGGMVRHQLAEEENPYQGYLNTQCVTLAEVLKPAGYRTYMSGKWHVGEFRPVYPVDRGFDHYYGLISGGMNYWNIAKGKNTRVTRTFVEDTTEISDQINNGFYSTKAYTDKALEYLTDHYSDHSEQPFFLYLAHQAPHWPLHAPDSMIAKYRGKYKAGWNQLRTERYQRMLEMGIADAKYPLSPTDEWSGDWDSLSEAGKDSMDLKMAVYAAMVETMDAQIARVVDYLEAQGTLDNTLIVFLSDNGAESQGQAWGQNFRPDLAGAIGSEDSYHSYGASWANASNTPYRKYKKYTFEGGFATPMIARWGEQIKDKNGITAAVGHITDLMATLVDLSGATYPDSVNGKAIHPMEGKSLAPVLKGESASVRSEADALYWEHEGNQAIRKGKWKLLKSKGDEAWKLYDLDVDRTELNDLAATHSEVVARLLADYQTWANKVGVIDRDPSAFFQEAVKH